MPAEHALLLGPSSDGLARLAERLRALGHATFHADTVEEAARLLERDRVALKLALVDSELAGDEMDLASLAQHTERDRLVCIGVGPRPEPAALERLGGAGVELALWDPAGDHALRFQTNRALAGSWLAGLHTLRSATRVPTEWRARVVAGGREKAVSVYSLSSSGAFLATHRPSLRGASIELELTLPTGRASLRGEVVYTNVPGNLQQRALPDGMAIRFTEGAESARRGLHATIRKSASQLVL